MDLQGYVAHENTHLPRTLQLYYAQDPMVVLGGGAVSYDRGTPIARQCAATSRGKRLGASAVLGGSGVGFRVGVQGFSSPTRCRIMWETAWSVCGGRGVGFIDPDSGQQRLWAGGGGYFCLGWSVRGYGRTGLGV